MKAEQGILQDVIGTSQPKHESKTRKYIRIIITFIMLGSLAYVVIMAAVRKFGA
jgi:hypothetical protein